MNGWSPIWAGAVEPAMTAAGEYVTGALVTALVAIAVLFVVRATQAVRRYYRYRAGR